MITGKQRSYLKKLAQEIKPTVMIGKEELSEAVKASIDDYLSKHELVKVRIQDGAVLDTKETANVVAQDLGAEFVQAIGHIFVLYRQASDPDKRKIDLRDC
ncbi:MAG: YhbY family RNA-binding protein [Mogibacterium sp.]|nr:YhbY family RNA-binding protein [Mogibacterium sp.]